MVCRRKAPPHQHLLLLSAICAAMIPLARCAPPDPAVQLAEARRLRAEGRPADAAEILSRLVARTPDDYAACYELALSLHAARKEDEALDAAGRALAASPSSTDARLL